MLSANQIEPRTSGRVTLHTSVGQVDIELWTNECPETCKSFIKLCALGYYDDSFFHRIIPKFLAQGGLKASSQDVNAEKLGSGLAGGDLNVAAISSKVEFHSRLRFSHPGILAVAQNQQSFDKNGNRDSSLKNHEENQFFVTLAACEWLNNKHTIFGKVTGNTIFNVMKFNEIDLVEGTEKPVEMPFVRTAKVDFAENVEVFKNLGINLEELGRMKEKLKLKMQEENVDSKKRRRGGGSGATKAKKVKTNLLSFGDDEVELNESHNNSGIKSAFAAHHSPDVKNDDNIIENDSKSNIDTGVTSLQQSNKKKIPGDASKRSKVEKLDASVVTEVDEAELLKAELRKLKQKAKEKQQANDKKFETGELSSSLQKSNEENSAGVNNIFDGYQTRRLEMLKSSGQITTKETKGDKLKDSHSKTKRSSRQNDTLAKFEMFRKKLKQKKREAESSKPSPESVDKNEDIMNTASNRAEDIYFKGGIGENKTDLDEDKVKAEEEFDENDENWMSAQLNFRRHIDDDYRKDTNTKMEFELSVNDYEVIDTAKAKHKTTKRKKA